MQKSFYLSIHDPFTNERISITHMDKHNRMVVDTKYFYVKQMLYYDQFREYQ